MALSITKMTVLSAFLSVLFGADLTTAVYLQGICGEEPIESKIEEKNAESQEDDLASIQPKIESPTEETNAEKSMDEKEQKEEDAERVLPKGYDKLPVRDGIHPATCKDIIHPVGGYRRASKYVCVSKGLVKEEGNYWILPYDVVDATFEFVDWSSENESKSDCWKRKEIIDGAKFRYAWMEKEFLKFQLKYPDNHGFSEDFDYGYLQRYQGPLGNPHMLPILSNIYYGSEDENVDIKEGHAIIFGYPEENKYLFR